MVVISKSGGTAETATNCATYLTLLKDLRVPKPGHSFVAVTTEGSKLDKQANEQQFRETFHMNEATGEGRLCAVRWGWFPLHSPAWTSKAF